MMRFTKTILREFLAEPHLGSALDPAHGCEAV